MTQPWAWLVWRRLKCWETRGWPTHYRGPLAIHAAATLKPESELAWQDNANIRRELLEAGCRSVQELPRGVVGAIVNLTEVRPTELAQVSVQERSFGDYSPGRYCFRLDDLVVLEEPVPARGHLNLWSWDWPDTVITDPGAPTTVQMGLFA